MNRNSFIKKYGLPIQLTKTGIRFSSDMTRPSFQAKDYLTYKEFFNEFVDNNSVLYYVYRNSSLLKDERKFKSYNLRHDLTLIFNHKIGKEASHTIGHFHKTSPDGITYPEVYQVIYGSAIFLLQNTLNKKIVLIYAKESNKVIVPPGFGHITINASKNRPLLVSNIFTNKMNVSDYSYFRKHRGAYIYPVWNKNKIEFVKNKNYLLRTLPIIKSIMASEIRTNLIEMTENFSLYKSFVDEPEIFGFLNNPRKFLNKISAKKLYKL